MIRLLPLLALPVACSSVESVKRLQPPQPVPAEGSVRAEPAAQPNQSGASWGTGHDSQFSLYKLNYAIIGRDDAKMQMSFQYRVMKETPLIFTFTSVSIWDIDRDSNPARDINFNAELFYRWDLDADAGVRFDTGYWHKSNGNAGPTSRNWDRLLFRGVFEGELLGRPLLATPTIFIGLPDSDSANDFEDYLGHWDTTLFWRDLISPDEPGNDLDMLVEVVGGKGSLTVGLQYRFDSTDFNPNLYMQFFTGYGDSQLSFNDKTTEVRFGISLF